MKKIWIAAVLSGAVLCAGCTRPASTVSNETAGAVPAPPATESSTPQATQTVTQTATPPFVPTQTADLQVPPGATPMAAGEDTANIKRITAAEAKALVDSGTATVIDVRDADAYASSHIAGALHMPMSRLQSEPNAIPRGKPVIAYCT